MRLLSLHLSIFLPCINPAEKRHPPTPAPTPPISYALPPLPMKQPATSPPAASIPHRKAATSKQPARLTAHHTLPLEEHTKTPRRNPFSDQNTLLPPAERRRAQAVVGVGVLVDGRRPGSGAAGGGGERSRGGSRGGGASRDTETGERVGGVSVAGGCDELTTIRRAGEVWAGVARR